MSAPSLQRMAAIIRPTTADETTRRIELTIATSADVGDGIRLALDRVPDHPPVVPVLLGHVNTTEKMAGRILDLRIERGALVGIAEFVDAPAAEQGWQLARSGCAVSVGATFNPNDLRPGPDGIDVVSRWTLRECSLIPVAADAAAVTRAAAPLTSPLPSPQMTTTTTQAAQADDSAPQDPQAARLERQALRLEVKVRRAAAEARLSPEQTQQIVDEHRNSGDETGALMAVVRAHREAIEAAAPVHAGHPARVATPAGQPGGLEGVIHRALRGERPDQPLWLTLRDAGIGRGSDPVSVWRSALSGEGRWLARGFLSTSDLPALLTQAGDRRLMERFQVAEAGIRAAASVRQLGDYRAATVADVGMVGTAKKILEGGEITFAPINEAAANYRPSRYGLGLSFTPEALANDDLSALDEAIGELADAMLDAEASALVDLLEGAANGRNAPDGKALFHADHTNTVSAGPMGIGSIGQAVEKLRNQKAIGGRYIAQEPAVLLVPTAAETVARQLLSEEITAAQSSEVNPWRALQIAVEPRLSGTYFYLLGNSRRPLELGRLTQGPVMTTETEFKTSAYRAKVEHAFGCIVQEHRSIVRIPVAGS